MIRPFAPPPLLTRRMEEEGESLREFLRANDEIMRHYSPRGLKKRGSTQEWMNIKGEKGGWNGTPSHSNPDPNVYLRSTFHPSFLFRIEKGAKLIGKGE